MAVAVLFDVDGAADVEHQLLGMGARAIATRPLLEAFMDLLQNAMTERFAAEGEGDWEPLSAATVAKKGSSVIGRETDAMMDALTSEGAEGALREIFGDELIFGVNLTTEDGVPYPAIFNDGSGRQPARPIFNLANLDLRRFSKAVQAYLMGAERSEFGVGDFGVGSTALGV